MRFEIYFAGRTTRRGLHLSGRSWSWPRERKRRLKEGRRREMERRERRRRRRRRRLLKSGWSKIFSALLAPLGEPRFRYMKVTFGPIHAQPHPQHTWNLLCLWCLSLHHLRGVVRKKWNSKTILKNTPGHSSMPSIFVSSPQQPLDSGTWHQAYLVVPKVSCLFSFDQRFCWNWVIFCLQIVT